MNRLIEKTVFSAFSTAWRLATWPTRTSPPFPNATTDGVRRLPSSLMMTFGSPPSITATTEYVVPRSIPMILDMIGCSFRFLFRPSGFLQYLGDESNQQRPVDRLGHVSHDPDADRQHPPRPAVLGGQQENGNARGDATDLQKRLQPAKGRRIQVDDQEIGPPADRALQPRGAVREQLGHRPRFRQRAKKRTHRGKFVRPGIRYQHHPSGHRLMSPPRKNNNIRATSAPAGWIRYLRYRKGKTVSPGR